MANTNKPISERLKEFRMTRYGGIRARMYEALGIRPQTYQNWEYGSSIPDDIHARHIAGLLNLPEEEVALQLYRDRMAKGAYISSHVEALTRQAA